MGVVVEDGTGIVGANSFASLNTIRTYCGNLGLAIPDDDDLLTQNAIEAGEYLQNEDRYIYRGVKNTYTQTMPWPRTGATEYRGQPIPSNAIPWRLVSAQCYLTYVASTDPGSLQDILERGGFIHSKKTGPLETVWEATAPIEDAIRKVQGFLAPLLVKGGYRNANVDVYFTPTTTDPFSPDEFDNQGATNITDTGVDPTNGAI